MGSTDRDLADARNVLRKEQAKHFQHIGASLCSSPTSTLDAALQALEWRKQFEPTNDPEVVRRGLWKFERELEEERIRLAEDLIRRVEPGPCEDPNYLALLAYQAASVEMAAGRQREPGDQRWSKFLLGTVHSADVDAFAQILWKSGYTVIGVHSALVDFIYQAAKAVVAAAHPVHSTDGKADIKANLSSHAIVMELGANSEPIERLYRTLVAYFRNGYPRAFAGEQVREESQPVLDQLVSMSERFVIAHEYGHRHAADLDWTVAAAANNMQWVQEFAADQAAMIATVLSGHTLDHFDPAVSLSGGVFSLACLHVLAQGISIMREGKVGSDEGSESHPPLRLRAEKLIEGFHRFFHAEYRSDSRGCELARIRKPGETVEVDASLQEHIRTGAFSWAKDLFVLWQRVQEMLLRDHDSGQQLHPMWIW